MKLTHFCRGEKKMRTTKYEMNSIHDLSTWQHKRIRILGDID